MQQQISEMRTFRSLYHQRELFTLIKLKHTTTKTRRFSLTQTYIYSSSNPRKSNPNSFASSRFYSSTSWTTTGESTSLSTTENPRISTTYDPLSGSLVTNTIDCLSGDENPPPPTSTMNLSSLDSVLEPEEDESSSSCDQSTSAWMSLHSKIEKPTPKKVEKSNSSVNDYVLKKKKGKSKVSWVCSECGESEGQWWGFCRSCKASGTLKEFSDNVDVGSKASGLQLLGKSAGAWLQPGEMTPQRLTDVCKGMNKLTWRIPLTGLFGAEVARVLGGGLVPGSLVLVGGDPGVGKSTLLLQIAAMIAEGCGFGGPAPVLYVSGEESIEQIGNRADRMRITSEQILLYSSTDIEDILEKVQALPPRALIVDSIQTVYLKAATGSAGSISQVKECTSAFLQLAKKTGIPILLIGHVTKTGDIAGPRVLEHIVDAVLYMEGEKYSAHRFLRSVKNRFGSTDELGVFEMSQCGLQAVANPSEIFLSEQYTDSEVLAGLAVAVMIDGSRSFLIEVQALCLSDSSVSRQVTGVDSRRTDMIISVLIKQAGLKLQSNAIFVNVVSGVKISETAGDLAIAAAICSSFLEVPIPNHFAFIGEVGLGGELRGVPRMEKRLNAVAKLGYKKCIVPKSAEKPLADLKFEGMVIVGCKNLKDVINMVFVPQ